VSFWGDLQIYKLNNQQKHVEVEGSGQRATEAGKVIINSIIYLFIYLFKCWAQHKLTSLRVSMSANNNSNKATQNKTKNKEEAIS
jgi:hypothetical protein